MKKKYIIGVPILIFVTVILVVIISFFLQDKKKEESAEGDISLYYVAADGLSFHQVPYDFKKKDDTLKMVKEVLKQLKKVPEGEECVPSIPEEVVWSDIYLENTNLIMDFTAEYAKLESAKEIFLRSSIVKTLTQIPGIQTVEFKVTGTPLMAYADQPVGMMDGDDFIDGTEENWGVKQEEKTILYFANKTGDKLVYQETEITVVNNVPMEQLIIEALAEGEEGNTPIPPGTKVMKTVTKDDICYVDLSKEFLNPMENVTGEVTVYAIVNSLTGRSGVSKVQFTVDGKTISNFRNGINLELPVGRNLDLIESKKIQEFKN